MKRFFPQAIILISVVAIAFTYYDKHRQPPIPPGPVALAEPLIQLVTDRPAWLYKGYSILPMASCYLRARVLSTERYSWDKEAKLSPVDIAVGWRGMSDSTYLNKLRITQSGRWYFFQYDQPVLPDDVIYSQSKNVHIIPASPEIARRAKTARKNQVIRAHGWLVKVTGPGGYTWVSSLSIGDRGANSCWVYWIEQLEIENPLVVKLNPVKIGS